MTRWEEVQRSALCGISIAVRDLAAMPTASLEDKVAKANTLMTSLRIMRMGEWRPVFPFLAPEPETVKAA